MGMAWFRFVLLRYRGFKVLTPVIFSVLLGLSNGNLLREMGLKNAILLVVDGDDPFLYDVSLR